VFILYSPEDKADDAMDISGIDFDDDIDDEAVKAKAEAKKAAKQKEMAKIAEL
jgi:hypothetical protein